MSDVELHTQLMLVCFPLIFSVIFLGEKGGEASTNRSASFLVLEAFGFASLKAGASGP